MDKLPYSDEGLYRPTPCFLIHIPSQDGAYFVPRPIKDSAGAYPERQHGVVRPFCDIFRAAGRIFMSEKENQFPREHRLGGKLAFAAVYSAGAKQSRGPLVAYSKPNQLSHCRWGLSVSRRVGSAVRRNRVKRMLRESIRLLQNDLPKGYDCVLVVRPHDPLPLAEYQKLLTTLIVKSHDRWLKTPKE
jgi:ribonuclease P protein component